jgi:2-oxo-4-hydroxy-4-carboxy-5-ureidoimidazoline decarboxylase
MTTVAPIQACPTPTIEQLNAMSEAQLVAHLAGLVEHSPWVVRRARHRHPFVSVQTLFDVLCDCINYASDDEQLALLRAHPELAGSEAQAGSMTTESTSEQGRLGLLRLQTAELSHLQQLNARYRERFGYPLLIALRLHENLTSVLSSAETRLANSATTERRVALQQIHEIMRGRLAHRVYWPTEAVPAAPLASPSSVVSFPPVSRS